jgi:cytochrome c oxidase assembly factor CtaG
VTSFHLPHLRQPLCIRMVAARVLRATYLQKATPWIVPAAEDKPLDWSSISSNVIATVLGGALLALAGGVLYIAWQVPRQQDQILYNQVEMKKTLANLTERMERLETNDRQQDLAITRQQHK